MSPVAPQLRDRHQQAQTANRELRHRLTEVQAALRSARDHGDQTAIALAELKVDEINSQLEMGKELEMALLRQMTGTSSYGGYGDTIFNDPAAITMLEGIAATSAPIGNQIVGRVMDAEQFAATMGRHAAYAADGDGDLLIPDSARTQPPYGIVRQLYRPTVLLDLIPTRPMTGQSFDYLVETGDVDDTTGGTAEGAIKPEDTSLELTEDEVRAVTIAAWRKMRRQAVADVQDLQATVTGRLTYTVQRRIERQVLAGTGENETLRGILSRTGVGQVVFEAGVPAADLILRGLTVVRLTNAEPTGIVLNPLTYERLLEQKGDDGHRLDSSGMFSGGTADSGWGVPVVQSPVIGPDRALVAAWNLAATLFVREGLSLRLSDSDQDDFIRNRLTALVETRVGLAVWQPGAICEVQLAESAEA